MWWPLKIMCTKNGLRLEAFSLKSVIWSRTYRKSKCPFANSIRKIGAPGAPILSPEFRSEFAGKCSPLTKFYHPVQLDVFGISSGIRKETSTNFPNRRKRIEIKFGIAHFYFSVRRRRQQWFLVTARRTLQTKAAAIPVPAIPDSRLN